MALKFRRWELQQIRVHLDAGLPSGAEMLASLMDPSADQTTLSEQATAIASKSLEVYFESFLWSLQDGSLQSDIAIVAQEDEDFLDVITDFLVEQLEGALPCPAAAS